MVSCGMSFIPGALSVVRESNDLLSFSINNTLHSFSMLGMCFVLLRVALDVFERTVLSSEQQFLVNTYLPCHRSHRAASGYWPLVWQHVVCCSKHIE